MTDAEQAFIKAAVKAGFECSDNDEGGAFLDFDGPLIAELVVSEVATFLRFDHWGSDGDEELTPAAAISRAQALINLAKDFGIYVK